VDFQDECDGRDVDETELYTVVGVSAESSARFKRIA
jgi:hypothetical protein